MLLAKLQVSIALTMATSWARRYNATYAQLSEDIALGLLNHLVLFLPLANHYVAFVFVYFS